MIRRLAGVLGIGAVCVSAIAAQAPQADGPTLQPLLLVPKVVWRCPSLLAMSRKDRPWIKAA